MSSKHTFTLTLKNNVTEKEGINYLVQNHVGFFRIDLATKKKLLELLKIEFKYLQSFDLVYLKSFEGKVISVDSIEANLDEIILVELKTTKKYLPNNPKGFFFGATENEFNFGRILGDKFRFCFVSIHEKGSSYALKTITELEQIIKSRRIQFQINL